ncbi:MULTISPECIES: helix-turn-helix domain-containing protein [Mycolicibacterium]|uniref:helix-turn-helix domain-containing protein n=1 Tax=Mycolicibacterium TaxID=1866885 RepID=UPI000A6DDA01|nr:MULTISPECIES: helix-turn-helix transcriptional regulator [Mycolicibacterium]MCW1821421.1 helix-turn-helix domain-containing protein [Mycolicibacterium senegalense]
MQQEPDGVARNFGKAVRQRRSAIGVSQRKLSELLLEKAGVKLDPSAITRIEKGQRDLKLAEAAAIAKVLDVSIDQLTREIKEAEPAGLIEIRDEYQALRKAYAAVLGQIESFYAVTYSLAVPLAADVESRNLLEPDELRKIANDAIGAEAACGKLFAALEKSPPTYGRMTHHRLGSIPLDFDEALKILRQVKKAADDAEA